MTQQQLIANQRSSLLIFAERNGITKTCQVFGASRTLYYKIRKQSVATGSLLPKVRRKPHMPNETALSRKKIFLKLVKEHPSWGPNRYAYEFRKHGIAIRSSSVWRMLKRFDLNNLLNAYYIERLKQENQPLTERTLRLIKQEFYKNKQGLWPGHSSYRYILCGQS